MLGLWNGISSKLCFDVNGPWSAPVDLIAIQTLDQPTIWKFMTIRLVEVETSYEDEQQEGEEEKLLEVED